MTPSPDAHAAPPGGTTADWLAELRAPFLTASVVPVAVGAAVAWRLDGGLDWTHLGMTLLAVVLLHLGANVTNDYWDFQRGTDVVNRQRTPFSGGSGLLTAGRLGPRAVLRLGLALLAAGALVGLLLASLMGGGGWWVVVLMGAVGVGGAYFYSAPPLSLASRGLGELVIGSTFGVLVVAGTCFVQTGGFPPEALAASVPVALWVAAIIWANQIPDLEADRATGKRTLVVRLGEVRSVGVLAALLGTAIGVVTAAAIAGPLPRGALLALGALAPSTLAIAAAARSHGLFPQIERAQAWTILSHLAGGILLCVGLAV
jgi:1,4-dihydroxy-2-naphthoate octaprenyltransferase